MSTFLKTNRGPRAVGPYSTVAVHDGIAYLSGVIGIVPESGKLAEGGTLAQARQVLDNLRVILEELGLGMSDVLKTTVFLTDIGEFGAVNTLYGEAFTEPYPARSCVQVAMLPLGAGIEIEAIAACREAE